MGASTVVANAGAIWPTVMSYCQRLSTADMGRLTFSIMWWMYQLGLRKIGWWPLASTQWLTSTATVASVLLAGNMNQLMKRPRNTRRANSFLSEPKWLMEMVLNSTWTLIRSAVMLMMNNRQVGCCVSYLIWHPCAPVHPGRCVSASIGHHQSLHVLDSPIKFSLVVCTSDL